MERSSSKNLRGRNGGEHGGTGVEISPGYVVPIFHPVPPRSTASAQDDDQDNECPGCGWEECPGCDGTQTSPSPSRGPQPDGDAMVPWPGSTERDCSEAETDPPRLIPWDLHLQRLRDERVAWCEARR